MKIAIIGTGNIGSRLAKHWAKAGHEILLGVRDAASAEVAALLGAYENMLAYTVKEAADNAEVITICVGFKQLQGVLDEIGDQNAKLIIETVNAGFDGGGEAAKIIEATTKSNRIIKAFNSIGAENLDHPVFNGIAADTFICGGDMDDINIVTTLGKQVGFENVYHIGGIEKEHLLEKLAQFWGSLAFGAKLGRNIAFKILTAQENYERR